MRRTSPEPSVDGLVGQPVSQYGKVDGISP